MHLSPLVSLYRSNTAELKTIIQARVGDSAPLPSPGQLRENVKFAFGAPLLPTPGYEVGMT